MKIDPKVLAQVAKLRLATQGVASGRQHGERHSPFLGRGMEFADYRPYGAGDDLRLVDWNVYARLDVVLVRLFHEDRNLSVHICIDASGSMKYGNPRKIDHGGELGAALALLALLRRDDLCLSCAGGSAQRTLVRGQNQNRMAQVLHYLHMVEPQGQIEPSRLLQAQLSSSKPDLLFFISDLLFEPPQVERLFRTLASCACHSVALHVLGEEELQPDLRDPQRLTDEETGETLDVMGGRAGSTKYNQALVAYLDDLTRRSRALGIQYFQAFTRVPVTRMLNTVLRRARIVESASGAAR